MSYRKGKMDGKGDETGAVFTVVMFDEEVNLLLEEEHNCLNINKIKNQDILTNSSIYWWFTSHMVMKIIFISNVEEP